MAKLTNVISFKQAKVNKQYAEYYGSQSFGSYMPPKNKNVTKRDMRLAYMKLLTKAIENQASNV